jgi:hypothetical protein
VALKLSHGQQKRAFVRLQKTMIDLIAVKRGETEDGGDFLGTLRDVDGKFLGFPSLHIFMLTQSDPFEFVFTTDSLFFFFCFS